MSITWQFLSLMHRDPQRANDELAMAFKTFDRAGDNHISQDELISVMKHFGEALTRAEVPTALALLCLLSARIHSSLATGG